MNIPLPPNIDPEDMIATALIVGCVFFLILVNS